MSMLKVIYGEHMLSRLALLLTTMCFWIGGAAAQCNITWADSPCSGSKLAVPAGAVCRVTNEFSCGTGGAYYRGYSYVNGDNEFVTGIMATTPNGKITTFDDVVASIKKDPISDKGQNFGTPQSIMAAQVLTFDSANGQRCIRALKMGARHSEAGYVSWVRGNKCAPTGQALSQEATNDFLSRLKFK
jgi:hypothetical protein